MDAATRGMARAESRCEYCRIHEDDEPFAFHIEHILPKKHGGDDHPSNLAWSCQSCNLGKSCNLADWLQGEIVALFHPRRQKWNRHFRWSGPLLVGKTKCGRTTIHVLNINAEDRVDLRRRLIALGGISPP